MLIKEEDKDRLQELYKKEEEELVKTLAERHSLPYIDLSTVAIEADALKLIQEEEARALGMAAFKATGRNLYIALISPKKEGVGLKLEELKGKNFIPFAYMASKASLERAWSRYKEVSRAAAVHGGILDISEESMEEVVKSVKTIDDIKNMVAEVLKGAKGYKVSKMLEIILGGATALDASDVHVEPEEKNVRLRLRLDGILQDVMFFSSETYKLLNSRVKLLSQLKLNVKETSQDGRFSVKLSGVDVEVRSSFIPGAYGESIVLRILNPKAISVSFENLGIGERLRKIVAREIEKPNGIILTTGPTGSGKTTALYAFLRKVFNPGIKIITIEDPIEYHLPGITQTQTDEKKGYTFAEGLRSALRQDPDILMVGEIRDKETAATAINAALTGHLVFSTLHTNNASGTIPRLIDLGVNPKIISSALSLTLAQRLVRTLCSCKKIDAPTKEELSIIEAVIKRMREEGLPEATTVPKEIKIFRPKGCEKCGNLGYKGRIGLFEGILMDAAVEKAAILNPSEREIKVAAIPQQIPDMVEDGILKVLQGITSLEELSRVVELS